jgi:hypothetical protein
MKEVITTFDNGNIKKNYFIDVNGNKEGKYIEYHENGNVHIKWTYHDDKKEGECIWYYEGGNVEVKCNYHNDHSEGECIHYYENGCVCEKSNYHNNKLEGEYIWYYENENIKLKCNFHDNKIEGEFFEYDESSQLIKHRIYENDHIVKYLLGEYINNVILLVENETKKEDDYCLICRDENNKLVKLNCGHIYHKNCLMQWMKQINKELCPLCQQKIDWTKSSNLQKMKKSYLNSIIFTLKQLFN